jgi:hypothetical protein
MIAHILSSIIIILFELMIVVSHSLIIKFSLYHKNLLFIIFIPLLYHLFILFMIFFSLEDNWGLKYFKMNYKLRDNHLYISKKMVCLWIKSKIDLFRILKMKTNATYLFLLLWSNSCRVEICNGNLQKVVSTLQ